MITTLAVIGITFLGMEGVAWFMHKYIMHGPGWIFHRDHHTKETTNSFFERNDVFFIFFAIIAITCFTLWSLGLGSLFLSVALGVTLYGGVYFFIHDLFIHQRIKVLTHTKNPYLLAIRRAHKMHHKHLGKDHGESFGMLWVPFKYYRQGSQTA
jgi:beta-carotene 3-hydroxylase